MRAEIAPRRARRVNWRQEYLHLALAAMTVFWLAGWVTLTLNWLIDLPLASALGVTALHLLASTALTRWLVHRRAGANRTYAALLMAAWLAASLTLLLLPSLARASGGLPLDYRALFTFGGRGRFPAGPPLLAWTVYLWWRGFRLGRPQLTLVRVAFNLRLGLLGLLVGMLVARAPLRGDLLALLPPFFFCGLLASSLARADSLTLDQPSAGARFGRGWVGSLAALALGLTGLGYLLALWMTGLTSSQAALAVVTLLRAALTLLFVLASPLLMVGQVVFDFVDKLLPDEMPPQVVEPGTVSSGGGDTAPTWSAALFALLDDALVVVIIAVVVLSVIAIIWLLAAMRGERADDESEQRETLGSVEAAGGARRALGDRWRQLTSALRALRRYELGRELFTALTIRRIYAQTERLAARRGYPRGPAETPYEYRAALARAFPALDSEVQRITEAYVAVRYGDVPEDPAALSAVRAAWERLQSSPAPDAP